jgi:hypothetical protein
MFPALSLMETRLQPTYRTREPYWRAPITPPSHDVHLPSWNWTNPITTIPEGAQLLTLDTNAAYLGALGTVVVAHSHLTHTAAPMTLPEPRQVDPGYYRITVPHWPFGGTIVSPLGDAARTQTEETLWVAHPTLVLLIELHEYGALVDVQILESWTARIRTGFRAWVDRLKEIRADLLAQLAAAHPHGAPEDCTCPACDRYGAFKEGYSAALSMMLTGEKCKTRRPDWTHAVYAQHAATQWRKAWRLTETGRPVIAMGHVDEITMLAADLNGALAASKPPFRYDPTGHRLGALKPKKVHMPARRDQDATLTEDGADIL